MKLRAVVFGALVIAATVGVPAAAEEGIHVSRGATDSYGCYAIEVWNGEVLLRTIPASMDGSTLQCTRLGLIAPLPSGILLFELRHGPDVRYAGETEVWASDGTTDGTVRLGSYPNQGRSPTDICDGGLQIVGWSAYISRYCMNAGTLVVATRGTLISTWTLPVPLRRASPAYVVLHGRIFFSATHPTKGRELWVSSGTITGTHVVQDIRRGAHGSYPGELSSDGTRLRFTANDGTGRRWWVSDGTRGGTHPE